MRTLIVLICLFMALTFAGAGTSKNLSSFAPEPEPCPFTINPYDLYLIHEAILDWKDTTFQSSNEAAMSLGRDIMLIIYPKQTFQE